MKQSKLKISVIRSFPITAGAFMLSIVLFAVGSIIDKALINPVDILKLFMLFVLIGVVNVFRFYIDGSSWSMSRPSVIKNIIFAPVYLILAILFAIFIMGSADIVTLVMLGVVFITVFTIIQSIIYFRAKAKTDEMNDALSIFLKEHEEDEKE